MVFPVALSGQCVTVVQDWCRGCDIHFDVADLVCDLHLFVNIALLWVMRSRRIFMYWGVVDDCICVCDCFSMCACM